MELWTAIIAAGAAILASALTSYLTYRFQRRGSRREYELKWLEERFGPAIDFLGRVYALVSNTAHTQEARSQMVNEIHNMVAGPSKESNVWCIAVLLDPEDTGLRDRILSTLTYARIAENNQEFVDYRARLHWSLQALAEEFRRERQAIVAGTSLEGLIRVRKAELLKHTEEFERALKAVRAFVDGKVDLASSVRDIEHSRVRGENLIWIIEILANPLDEEKQARLEAIHHECKKRGWLPADQP